MNDPNVARRRGVKLDIRLLLAQADSGIGLKRV
jgi:hypothetical protein